MELCHDLGLAAEEVALPLDALAGADEAFLTSTVREVQPIAHVDGAAVPAVGPASPGPITVRLAAAFADLVARTSDP